MIKKKKKKKKKKRTNHWGTKVLRVENGGSSGRENTKTTYGEKKRRDAIDVQNVQMRPTVPTRPTGLGPDGSWAGGRGKCVPWGRMVRGGEEKTCNKTTKLREDSALEGKGKKRFSSGFWAKGRRTKGRKKWAQKGGKINAETDDSHKKEKHLILNHESEV